MNHVLGALNVLSKRPRGIHEPALISCNFSVNSHMRFATEGVLIAAAENTVKALGKWIIELLLDQREGEAVVTNAMVEAAIANPLSESITIEL
ncbi:hypothetical protein GB937_004499 [Aspergillus fischeri]|nr:hypothetical protein GB937_004499 [Aspergillus fischeri]